jgi:outer membrane protein assembly factor BamB
LHCFDANSGKVLWEYDLVKQFAAKPVQFGFSASPLVYGKQFIVHVGGTATCLLALDAESGKVIWKAKAAEPSYASPVLLPGEKGDVIVQVTRDELLGLSAKDGSLLWSYPLPDAGLTNVPTPLVLSERRLLISGQGARGTRLLQVVSDKDKTEVKELWKNQKARLFYCNALKDEEAVYGSVGEFLVALRLSDGSELWRERGQADANLLQVGSEVLILRGDGRLTRSRLSPKGLEASDPEELLKSRTWTAPTLIDNTLYARSEKEITAVRFMGREKK